MIIIGEKINGTRGAVNEAIRNRDAGFIAALASEQEKAGATYLDVNAGTSPDRESDDLVWLVKTAQEASPLPLCLDSANPAALSAALKAVEKTPIINSVSAESHRITGILPLAVEHRTGLVLLPLGGEKGIPATSGERLKIIDHLIGLAREGGLPDEGLYVDPLVTAISTGRENGLVTLETIKMVREKYPSVNITCGLSNISFGMPLRPLINRTFAAMAVQMGLNSAIMDPCDRELYSTMLAARLLTGLDRNCMNFNRAYRAGRIRPTTNRE